MKWVCILFLGLASALPNQSGMAKSFERQSPPPSPATCRSFVPPFWRDGYCDDFMNNAACGFDGGDCCYSKRADYKTYCSECACKQSCPGLVKLWWGDGYCDDSMNNAACSFDGGDCCKRVGPNWNIFCKECKCLDPFEKCSAGWTPIGDNCYKFENFAVGKNYQQALDHCKSLNARLFEPRTWDSSSKVFAAAKVLTFWLGIKRDPNNIARFIYESSGTPIVASFFGPGEPSNWNEQCVQIGYGDGRWNDLPCSIDFPNVVCERTITSRTSSITIDSEILDAPEVANTSPNGTKAPKKLRGESEDRDFIASKTKDEEKADYDQLA